MQERWLDGHLDTVDYNLICFPFTSLQGLKTETHLRDIEKLSIKLCISTPGQGKEKIKITVSSVIMNYTKIINEKVFLFWLKTSVSAQI